MADNINAQFSDADTNEIGPLRFVDIGGVYYAVSILAQADGTLLSTIPISNASLSSLDTKTPALGQALAAASSPVVLPEAQITALTPPAAITGFAEEATLQEVVTAVEAIQAGQLPDGHNVTVSGTVDLGETDNAVLDAIAANTNGSATLAEQQTQTTSLERLAGKYVDYDTGAGTDSVVALGILLPGNGGAVIGGTSSNPIRVDVTGTTTQPVSGTVTANIGTIGTLATAANQTTGNTSIANVDTNLGAKADSAASSDTGTFSLIALFKRSLEKLTTLTGLFPSALTGSGNFKVSLAESTASQAVTNADITAAAGSLNVIDDWDESDRAKVNPIAGQAGVQGGSGTVSANTQRVVLATDVALPTGTNSIGQVTANAGTNLNTSTLALEAGGNLAAAATSLGVVEDVVRDGYDTANKFVGIGGYDPTTEVWRELLTDEFGRILAVNAGGNVSINDTVAVVPDGGGIEHDSNINVLSGKGWNHLLYAKATAPTNVGADGRAVLAWSLLNGSQVVNLAVGGTLVTGSAGLPITPATGATFVLGAGTAGIGKLTANSGVDIGDVDVISLPALAAGTNLIGRTSSSDETSTVYNGTTALTPKYAPIAASSSGNNTLVTAVASKKIRVLAYNLMGNGAVNAKFQSGASGTDLTGLKYIAAAGGGICAPFNKVGWFETASNTLLNLNLSGAVAVGGELVYVEV